jgi:Na+/H+ antiporter NhaC
MALTLFITATAQSLITLVALYTDMQNAPGSSIMEIILINGGLIALFTLSGILFQVADKEQTGTLSNAPGS